MAKFEPPPVPKPDDVKLVDCADCGAELLAQSEWAWLQHLNRADQTKFPPVCRHWISGRPYCGPCSTPRPAYTRRQVLGTDSRKYLADPDPSQEDALRAWENEQE